MGDQITTAMRAAMEHASLQAGVARADASSAEAAQPHGQPLENRCSDTCQIGSMCRDGMVSVSAKPTEGIKLDFLRFEFKYILRKSLRDRIERELCHFMALDPFVAGQKDCSYIVRSLYYDDPAYSSYYEKIDGALRRAKFRLRTYTNSPDDSCATYLEIKGRYNSLVFKHRAGFKNSATSRIFADCSDTTERILSTIKDSSVTEQFRYELVRKQIQPVMLIDYVRRPYFSKYDSEFRLTLDDDLHGTATDRLFPQTSTARRALMPGHSVMEIKFKDRIPLWFHRIIRSYSLQRQSISKVCKGIEACQLVPQLD
jgi:VTC domain-containing protein